MDRKFAKVALPALVMGLALGLMSVPAASFAQDQDHHGRGGDGGGNRGGGERSHGNGGGGNAQPQDRTPRGGDHGGGDWRSGGGRSQGGQSYSPPAHTDTNVNVQVGAGGGQPGYRGNDNRGAGGGDHRGDDRGYYARADFHRDQQDQRNQRGDDHWRGDNNRGGENRGADRGNDHRGDDHRGDDRWRDDHRGDRGHFDFHGDQRFHDYSGVRIGFYFAPGRGYYHVPDQYYGHRWGRGEYLPRFFFSYRIYDPDYYDLPYPPYGCAWMFVGEDAVLVDLDTGEIVDIVYGVF